MADGPSRVLVVDDDPMQLELVGRSLRAHGFTVETAAKALDVPDRVEETQPDLVLLDVNFPTVSGDLIVSVARKNAPPQTRFILYSASDESKLRQLARAAGADGYLSKSIQGDELARKIASLLRPR